MPFGWNKNMETVSPINPSAVAALGHTESEVAGEVFRVVLFSGGGTGLGYAIGRDWKSAAIGGLAGVVLWALVGRG